MSKYLLIANNGEMDINALTLLGASTKRDDDTKIGMFGSGNKYALAYLIRNGVDCRVFTGEREIKISTKRRTFNEQTFDVIAINGAETSITTDFGKDWSLWQALREIYSNALDEGLTEFKVMDAVEPTAGSTNFYIQVTREVDDFIGEFDRYFTRYRKPIYTCDDGTLYYPLGGEANIYRKGIRCYDANCPSLFDYDINDIHIDESRTVKYYWEVAEKMARILFGAPSQYLRKLLRNFTENTNNMLERKFGDSVTTLAVDEIVKANRDNWIVAIGTRKLAPYGAMPFITDIVELKNIYFVPAKVYDILINILGIEYGYTEITSSKGVHYKEVKADGMQQAIIDGAIDFLRRCNYKILFPIKVADFGDSNVGGMAADGSIIIALRAIEKGKDTVAKVIIEEQIHLHYDCDDCTRAMQDAFLDELVNYMKLLNVTDF